MLNSSRISADASVEMQQDRRRLVCSDDWSVRGVAGLRARLDRLAWPAAGELHIDFSRVTQLDTAGVWILHQLMQACNARGLLPQLQGMRAEHEVLLRLVAARAPSVIAPPLESRQSLLAWLGRQAWDWLAQIRGMLNFVGANMVALARVRRPAHLRWRLILSNIQHAGFDALPIVGLLSFLVGMVIAYQGSVQLARFGANIYIADLVGHAVLRELAPMMVAIVVAGRSGSAYAAQIGTMKVSEEIDALRSMGVSPFALLVLPKLLAMLIVLPLLTVYADVLGVLGGMVVASGQMQVDAYAFLDRFDDTIKPATFLFGVGKTPVFAVIIALVGCYSGFQAQGSADSVGRQTTASVVQSIFLIIIADAIFSVAASLTQLGWK